MKRGMFDCETLAIPGKAVVLSIGACVWENGKITNKLYFELDAEDQKKKNRIISPDTLTWWNAQKTQMPEGNVDPKLALKDLMALMADCDEVWSRGIADERWIDSLCEDYEVEKSWDFRKVRDSRTLDTFGEASWRPNKPPVSHNSLDDAVQQALDVQYVLDIVEPVFEVKKQYGFWKRLWLKFTGDK
jgi:hypothetical protein